MKTFNKIFLTVAGILFMFTSCEDAISDREVSPVMPENCQGVYFPATNPAVVELEPTEPAQISITVARTDSVSAVEVPLTVETNTGNVFAVPAKAVFAAGEKTAAITVTFPDAAEGTTYELKLSVSGDEYVNRYASTVPYVSTSVTRIKWEETAEPFIFVDGTFSTFYGVSPIPMYVETEKAVLGDNVVRYRFKNAYRVATPGVWEDDEYIPEADADGIYNGYYYNYPGDVDETKDYYIVIEIDNGGNVSMTPCEIGVIWSYGMFSIGSIYGYLSTDISSYPLGILKDGIITFPANSLYVSRASYSNGGKYPCSNPTVIYTTKEAYLAANMKIEDFNTLEYEGIEGAVSEFESAAYSENWNQSIAKAVDIDPENEDSEYKNLYYLADLYAGGYGLAFYYDGKTVSVPAEQNTGKQALGKDIYVSQSESIESGVTVNSKGVKIYTLGLIFHFEDGTVVGEFAETFYYSEEPVSYDLEDFYGNFTMTGKSVFGASYPDAAMDVTVAAGTDPNTFVITGIDYAAKVDAVFDHQTSVMLISPQMLPDFNEYDMTLYTYTQGDHSVSASLSFTFNMKGQLTPTPDSEASGYMIYSETAKGWVDGYYDLLFTRQATAATAAAQTAVSNPAVRPLNAVSVTNTQKCSTGNFAVHGKLSAKTSSKRNLTPLSR
jgi:hypothetical protein